jgi:hypothetical protein
MDSFLDIVTNVVGLMILVFMVALLNAGDPQVRMRPPRRQEADPDAKQIVFDCRDNRIQFVDMERLRAEFERGQSKFERQVGQITSENASQITTVFESEFFGNDFYRITNVQATTRLRFAGSHVEFAIAFHRDLEPRNSNQGESLSQVLRDSSEFRQRVESAHSPEDLITFVVTPDSWEVFLKARHHARKHDWSMNWIFLEIDETISVGPGKREQQ